MDYEHILNEDIENISDNELEESVELDYESILNEDAESISDNELEESVKLNYEYVLNENLHLTEEDRSSLLAEDLENYFAPYKKLFECLKLSDAEFEKAGLSKVKIWNQLHKLICADTSRKIGERYIQRTSNGKLGMYLSDGKTLTNNSDRLLTDIELNVVNPNLKKFPCLKRLLSMEIGSEIPNLGSGIRKTPGRDFLLAVFNYYLTGNETRFGIAC